MTRGRYVRAAPARWRHPAHVLSGEGKRSVQLLQRREGRAAYLDHSAQLSSWRASSIDLCSHQTGTASDQWCACFASSQLHRRSPHRHESCTGAQGPQGLASEIGSEEKLGRWLRAVCPVSVALRLATWPPWPADRHLSDTPVIGPERPGPPELRQHPAVQSTGRPRGASRLAASRPCGPESGDGGTGCTGAAGGSAPPGPSWHATGPAPCTLADTPRQLRLSGDLQRPSVSRV